MNHFKSNMFSNTEKTRLLISAMPTEFGNFYMNIKFCFIRFNLTFKNVFMQKWCFLLQL